MMESPRLIFGFPSLSLSFARLWSEARTAFSRLSHSSPTRQNEPASCLIEVSHTNSKTLFSRCCAVKVVATTSEVQRLGSISIDCTRDLIEHELWWVADVAVI